MLYRDLRHLGAQMDQILAPLSRSVLSESLEDMTAQAEIARESAERLALALDAALRTGDGAFDSESGEGRTERILAQTSLDALRRAVRLSERLSGVTDITMLRARLLDVKAQADLADAYLRAAIGHL